MKTVYLLLVMMILSACASPQVTVTSEVTVTSTQPPTETPLPTATATPIAVDGVADVDGILYIFDETTQAWAALPALEAPYAKVIVDENNKVVALGTDGAEMYTLDMGTGKWIEAVTFEPMTLETDPSKMGVCTYEDITSGRLDWSVDQAIKNGDIVFPEDAHNGGWENRRGESNSAPIFLSEDSENAMQLVNLCKINGDFLDLPDRTGFVASVAVLNTDGTVGTLHFLMNDTKEKTVQWLLGELKTKGSVGIRKELSEEGIQEAWNGPFALTARLYRTQGDKLVRTEVDRLQIEGIVSNELERILLTPSGK